MLRRGTLPEAEESLRVGPLEISWAACSASLDGRPLALTTAEFTLLGLLARSRGLPLSYPDVGATSGARPDGYVRDHHRVRLGLPLFGQETLHQVENFFESGFQLSVGRTFVAELLVADGA